MFVSTEQGYSATGSVQHDECGGIRGVTGGKNRATDQQVTWRILRRAPA